MGVQRKKIERVVREVGYEGTFTCNEHICITSVLRSAVIREYQYAERRKTEEKFSEMDERRYEQVMCAYQAYTGEHPILVIEPLLGRMAERAKKDFN